MQLDVNQTKAVQTTANQALVIAGPGAGKTRVIVERAAYLIEECKISPYEIFISTFTRRAAGEIRDRLVERVGYKAYHMSIGTFHATALHLLHRFGDLIGYHKNNSTVYGEFEEQFLLRDVATEMAIYNGKSWKIPKKQVDAVFAKYYQEGIEPPDDDPLRPLFLAFVQRCRENNSYTYGNLLTGLMLLLPHCHQYLSWKHLIIDEGHDCDLLQFELIKTIQEYCKASLFIVADLDQTLYSWRGACPEYIMEHQKEFTTYILENNYRSMPGIVEASNRLIEHNQDRITKTMRATREGGESRVIIQKNVDSQFIVNLMSDPSLGSVPPYVDEPVAILARNHYLLEKIDRLMEEADIPHEYVGRSTALMHSESFIKFHAFLKLTINPLDNFSFLLIKDVIGLTREEYAQIRIMAAKDGKSHFQAWLGREIVPDQIVPWGFFSANEFKIQINLLSQKYPGLSPEAMAFIGAWLKDRKENVSVAEYLSWLATYDITDEIKEDQAGITLLTIHAAKGLEWPVVIVAGANEGIIPSKQAINGDEIEAERRLFYVAMTRAQDQLLLTCRPEVQERDGKIYENPISRFIGEI